MLTKLLTPPEASGPLASGAATRTLVEEIGATNLGLDTECAEGASSNTAEREEPEGADDIDWYTEQVVPSEAECSLLGNPKYGFALQKSGLSGKLLAEFGELLELSDPDSISSSEKKQQRIAFETEHFCADHYLADKYDNDEIEEIINYQPWWYKQCADCKLSQEAKDLMLKLPKKKYLIDKEVLPCVYFSLVDIIFAYAFNHRTLFGENNAVSGWTMAKLARTLCWLDTFTSLQDVIVSCFRRALIFPLHRNWDVCIKVLEDVQTLFAGGKKPLLKCLLDVYSCMVVSDPHYVFNDLYITDYCVWIQSAKSSKLESLAHALKSVVVKKSDLDLEIEELEHAAELVLKEQGEGVSDVADRVGRVTLSDALDSDDYSESEDEVKVQQSETKEKKDVKVVCDRLQALDLAGGGHCHQSETSVTHSDEDSGSEDTSEEESDSAESEDESGKDGCMRQLEKPNQS
jgi:protein SHQ1